MATIEKYETASGVTLYRVRYRKTDNRQTDKRGFRTKKAAEAFANTVEVKKLTGEFIPETAGRITVAELDWLTRKKQATAPSNYRMIESAWRVHVLPKWGRWQVAKVTVPDIESWVAQMVRDGRGATTVLRAHGVLSGVLGDAVKARRLASNPARGIEGLPRKSARRHVYLSADDVHRLAAESGEHRPLVYVLAFCGLRWGEAIALRVRDVEFLRRRLVVAENAVQLGVDHAVGQTKGRAVRSVPVPSFVLDELSPLCSDKEPGWLVFAGPDGKYLPRPKSSGGWFAGAVKRSKVQPITPHDLRHTAASLAVSAGVNVLALQRMLGHKSAKVTLDTYADLFDTDLDAVAVTLHKSYSLEKCGQSVGTEWAGSGSANKEIGLYLQCRV
ncbi:MULTISPECIES: site-specific integrase [Mycobacterium avium complex (MAC)]|uniref:Site-specific integrase n=2 Tax=Mycobacterium avium complex (MAC) TaxID=120793 RepID=A0ABX3TQT1_9MYCO|nr:MULTISPECIES: site-specific integrase [Mycobacterium avium complex (MAC)]AXO25204.1 site-specific integrase [Mycobacterium avium subsp. hominissuis]ETZ44214.1 phage integrase family protein [Mycobacterium avium MAV_061107_1842]MBG0728305.1 site-specific integrase [Mycobacterium avium]MBZ4548909.1 site-specific integrase [Mycobacterium avium subsp. hominissuis]MBZ4583084.1 site-specific integrase [Mycobacterium avium subsp. hominissuis]